MRLRLGTAQGLALQLVVAPAGGLRFVGYSSAQRSCMMTLPILSGICLALSSVSPPSPPPVGGCPCFYNCTMKDCNKSPFAGDDRCVCGHAQSDWRSPAQCKPPPSLCSLNGCWSNTTGRCECLQGWKGEQCATLNQGKSASIWPPGGTARQDPTRVAASWGAGLVGPVAGVSDKWHLWVDTLCLTDPTNSSHKLRCSHTHNAQIVHAVSEAATGPFEFADVAVQPSVNNPAAVYHPQSKLYLLYYVDMAYEGVMTPPTPSWAGMCTGAPINVTHATPATEHGNMHRNHTGKVCTDAGNCEVVAIQCTCHCSHPCHSLPVLAEFGQIFVCTATDFLNYSMFISEEKCTAITENKSSIV